MGLDQYISVTRKTTEQEEDFAYFRKMNALQGYFEQRFNIQNLEKVYLTMEIIDDILQKTKQVLHTHALAEAIFPVQQGFFYGSYSYDEYYFDSVQEVHDTFQELKRQWKQFSSAYYMCWY